MNNPASDTLAISVIVSTYNRPDALTLVLSALAEQDYRGFEVIVADDGSSEVTASLIRAHPLNQHHPLHHLWQPDDGFRKAEILNQAILKAMGEYVVFLDGDCIPRPNWLSRNAALAQPRRFVTGHRALLSRAFTEHVIAKQIPVGRYTFKDWMRLWRSKKTNRFRTFFYLPDGPWRHLRRRCYRFLFGCNMAVWRRDLHTVGGFDERYRGWGSEDCDLAARLINARIFRKDGRYATGVIHLWHEHADRSRHEHNECLLRSVVTSGVTRAVKGLDQYTSQNAYARLRGPTR